MFSLGLLVAGVGATRGVRGASVSWSAPDLDTFSYENAVGPGGRILAPSFTGGLTLNAGAFMPQTVQDPARLGMAMMAFSTLAQIPTTTDWTKYQVSSATVTLKMMSGSGGTLLYDPSPISNATILNEMIGGGTTTLRPMELYGVGFRDGYTGFDFTNTTPGPPLFGEGTHPYGSTDGGYIPYPIVGNPAHAGQHIDVSNSLTGGFSATATGNTTAPFDVTPWAIGKVNGLATDAPIPNDTTFSFQLDLSLPGVRDYAQQSLTKGGLGFFLSSLHNSEEFGLGGGYPQWYTKEAVGVFAGAAPAMLAIDYRLVGDFDGNGVVNTEDYSKWKTDFGTHVVPGSGADANGNGVIDAGDYTQWRDHLGNASAGSGSLAADVVPEPNPLVLCCLAVLSLGGGGLRFRRATHLVRLDLHRPERFGDLGQP
ncbi:MAG TPA: hypothetical protein VGM76_06490, partial [Lacipirellulaceae bacterium]